MSIFLKLISKLLRWLTERGARYLTLPQAIEQLQNSEKAVLDRFAAAQDTPRNIDQAQHIIGIERWGQRRLRVALGESLKLDEYDAYRPDADSLEELKTIFQQTRQETLDLVRQLQDEGMDASRLIRHNDMGDITLRGWLHYLNEHARREASRLR